MRVSDAGLQDAALAAFDEALGVAKLAGHPNVLDRWRMPGGWKAT